MNKEEAYKSLEKKFKHFIDVHKFPENEKEGLIKIFKNNTIFRPFDKAFSWYAKPQGYDYFYFLSLRWLMLLIKVQKEYTELYTCGNVVMEFYRLLSYSQTPNIPRNIINSSSASAYYTKWYDKNRDFYLKFYEKNI